MRGTERLYRYCSHQVGKIMLDKARERGVEGHREVIQILQSSGR